MGVFLVATRACLFNLFLENVQSNHRLLHNPHRLPHNHQSISLSAITVPSTADKWLKRPPNRPRYENTIFTLCVEHLGWLLIFVVYQYFSTRNLP